MDPKLQNISDYAGKFSKEIIAKIFLSLMDQEITVLTNIKGKTWFPKLIIGKGLKPYTGQFVPNDRINYTKRAVDPQMFQHDTAIDVRRYHGTWLTEMVGKNAKENKMPFENFTWAAIIDELHEELIPALFKGIQGGVDVDTALNIFNGFEFRILELIAAGKAPIATGAIDSVNAFEIYEGIYEGAMDTFPAWRRKLVNLYCSSSNADKYIDAYRTKFNGQDPYNWSDTPGPLYLKKNKGKVKITPVDWLADSNRLIISPKENLVMATDALSDFSTIKVVEDVYNLKAGITGTVDCQILDDEACWFNELS